jgi:serine protein kinase
VTSQPDNLSDFIASQVKADYLAGRQSLAWDDYLKLVAGQPYLHTRASYQYIRDAITSFGVQPVKDMGRTFPRFALFADPFFGGQKRVVGQVRAIAALFKHIDACAKQEEDESIYVLIGPPGTGKSRIHSLIEKGLEEYSRSETGAVYTVNWLFRDTMEEDGEKRGLGFRERHDLARETGSYASLPDEEIFSRVECNLRDHPLALIPRRQRKDVVQRLVDQRIAALKADPTESAREELKRLETYVLPQKLVEAEPCRNCQNIRDRLLDLYGGDWRMVTKHVQVVRWQFSLEMGRGLAEVDPGVNVDTELSPVTIDENKSNLSGLLRGIRLYAFHGKPASANRGLINYQDMFNKNHSQLQHLLSAVEEKTVSFGDVTQKVDYAIFGSTNLPENQLLQQNALTEGLRDRIESIPVPYLLNVSEEEQIYEPNVGEIRKSQHISPHTIRTGALFTVLTRLKPPSLAGWIENERRRIAPFEHDKARFESRSLLLRRQEEFTKAMTLLQKAKLYSGDITWVPHDRRDILSDAYMSALREEFRDDEGHTGRSPRWFKRILGRLSMDENNRCINPFQVYAQIAEASEDGTRALLDLVQEDYNRVVVREVEEALFDVTESDLMRRVEAYLERARAYVRKETVMDTFQKKLVDPEEYLGREEEFLQILPPARNEFRVSIVQRFGKAAVSAGTRPDPRVALPELFDRYRDRIHRSVRDKFNFTGFLAALDRFDPAERDLFAEIPAAPDKTAAEVGRVLNNLRRRSAPAGDVRAGYCNDCAKKVLKYALTNEKTRSHFGGPSRG